MQGACNLCHRIQAEKDTRHLHSARFEEAIMVPHRNGEQPVNGFPFLVWQKVDIDGCE